MDQYLNFKFPVWNNEELSGHFILITNKNLVESIGKRIFSKRSKVVTRHKIISAYKWPAVKGLRSFYCFIFIYFFFLHLLVFHQCLNTKRKTYIGPLKKATNYNSLYVNIFHFLLPPPTFSRDVCYFTSRAVCFQS